MSEIHLENISSGKARRSRLTPVDIHLGRRMRIRRTMLGISQEKLSELLGITFQQVQKYESGKNRISASRLYDLSHLLNVPVQFFFDDMDYHTTQSSPRSFSVSTIPTSEQNFQPLKPDPLLQQSNLELVKNFCAIKKPQVANAVFNLIKSLASS